MDKEQLEKIRKFRYQTQIEQLTGAASELEQIHDQVFYDDLSFIETHTQKRQPIQRERIPNYCLLRKKVNKKNAQLLEKQFQSFMKRLDPQIERFIQEYLIDFDSVRAYYAAGYTADRDEDAAKRAKKILDNPIVKIWIVREKAKIAKILQVDAENLIYYFLSVYSESLTTGDLRTAVSVLDRIAKHLGWYQADNWQKAPILTDAERIREQLEALGIDFRRKNDPVGFIELKQDPSQLAENSSEFSANSGEFSANSGEFSANSGEFSANSGEIVSIQSSKQFNTQDKTNQ